MKPDFTNFKGLSKDPILETNFENELLMSQLISEIRKNPDHISLTMTGTGLVELIKAVQQVIYEEINEEKANQQDSDIELITKQDVIDKLHVSSTTLWIWEKRKYLVPVKIGRRIFYKRRDVNNLMGGK
jgi:ribosomal protein L11 methylase PrmA